MEDHELFKRLKKNEERAFDELFQKYFIGLKEYACFYINSSQLAEDIVQDVFYTIWEKRKSLNIYISLKSYLYRSIHNKCIQHLRHHKIIKRHNHSQQVKLEEALLMNKLYFETGLSILFEKEINDIADGAIGKLPLKTRDIYFLSRKKHKKNVEIAEELKISEKVVEYHITRALILLREELKDYL